MAEGGSSARDAFRPPKDDPDDKTEMIHYDEIKLIGQGGFGTVREVLHRGSNTTMAMKKLAVGIMYFDETTKAADKERDNIRKLTKHVNIVRCFDAFQTNDNHLAIPMEYCDLDLENFMKVKSNRKNNILISVAFQIASGLASLHSQNPPIVHRDIKPANILLKLKPRTTAKLSDFGLSSILDSGEGFVDNPTMKQVARAYHSMKTTVGGHGTLPFLGPEFYAAKDGQGLVDGRLRIGPAVDIFALGVVFLCMFCYNTSDYGKSWCKQLQT